MMDYILQNMQYRYMENVIQQINRGAVQNVTKPSLSGTGFAHIFQQTQMAESGIIKGAVLLIAVVFDVISNRKSN